MHPLDNPIWQALTTDNANLAEGGALARRFPAAIGPLAGMADQSPAAYRELFSLCKPGEQLVFFLPEAVVVPDGWTLDVAGRLTQMVYEGEPIESDANGIDILGEADIPDMLALTHLTQPGPFRQRTNELGLYVGIHQEQRLGAMAGERLNLTDYTEISAVCTHPDFQGRGYAATLIRRVIRHIQEQGKTPFLHTRPDNVGAIRVYERLGFRTRQLLHLAVVKHG